MRGRPSKLTPEVQAAICKTLTTGVDYETACMREGIGPSTFREWIRRGRAGEAPFEEFWMATEQAMANVECAVTANVIRASRSQWGAGAWWLKWKHNRGATTQNVNVSTTLGGPSGPAPALSIEAANAIRRQVLFGDQVPRALPDSHEPLPEAIEVEVEGEANDFGAEPEEPRP
jgi:hypothetical protein